MMVNIAKNNTHAYYTGEVKGFLSILKSSVDFLCPYEFWNWEEPFVLDVVVCMKFEFSNTREDWKDLFYAHHKICC